MSLCLFALSCFLLQSTHYSSGTLVVRDKLDSTLWSRVKNFFTRLNLCVLWSRVKNFFTQLTSRELFFISAYFIMVFNVFIFTGLESLFVTTSRVILKHNIPDLLNLSQSYYYSLSVTSRFLWAGFSGASCIFNQSYLIILLMVIYYKCYISKHAGKLVSWDPLKYLWLYFLFAHSFVILNGLNVISFYTFDSYIGHKMLYSHLPVIYLSFLMFI